MPHTNSQGPHFRYSVFESQTLIRFTEGSNTRGYTERTMLRAVPRFEFSKSEKLEDYVRKVVEGSFKGSFYDRARDLSQGIVLLSKKIAEESDIKSPIVLIEIDFRNVPASRVVSKNSFESAYGFTPESRENYWRLRIESIHNYPLDQSRQWDFIKKLGEEVSRIGAFDNQYVLPTDIE
ncbi:hypothetical protein D6829_01210 [Candidatus Pacearchaeota archaeon]|nr:MAG: hypothetical protein D6829_01210 [Candidatus Pacearchaeota archaeon]